MPHVRENTNMGGDSMKSEESIVGPGLVIEGKLEGNGSIRLAGRVKGQVAINGDVTVDPDGTIEGDVKAHRVQIAGRATANILAASAVEVTGSASVVGDVQAPTVQVSAGAKIRGSVISGWTDTDLQDQSNNPPTI
jgi:cytoskeletal protein CcmA (bactofilin family)